MRCVPERETSGLLVCFAAGASAQGNSRALCPARKERVSGRGEEKVSMSRLRGAHSVERAVGLQRRKIVRLAFQQRGRTAHKQQFAARCNKFSQQRKRALCHGFHRRYQHVIVSAFAADKFSVVRTAHANKQFFVYIVVGNMHARKHFGFVMELRIEFLQAERFVVVLKVDIRACNGV